MNTGIVIISYPGKQKYDGGTVTTIGGSTVHTFTSSGNLTKINWEPYYTILPRRINGRWYCCSRVYRRFNLDSQGGYWHYGDDFDILKNL